MVKFGLRINGRVYIEVFNRTLTPNFNLVLYLIKYLRFEPVVAVKNVLSKEYTLINSHGKPIIKTKSSSCHIQLGIILDLVKRRKKQDDSSDSSESNSSDDQQAWQATVRGGTIYCLNPWSGFKKEWLERYIVDYMMQPKGQSSKLIQNASWTQIKTINEECFTRSPDVIDCLIKLSDPITAEKLREAQEFYTSSVDDGAKRSWRTRVSFGPKDVMRSASTFYVDRSLFIN